MPGGAAVAATLNSRPRKTLGWRTPAEALDAQLMTGAGTWITRPDRRARGGAQAAPTGTSTANPDRPPIPYPDFFATLKEELVNRRTWPTYEQLRLCPPGS